LIDEYFCIFYLGNWKKKKYSHQYFLPWQLSLARYDSSTLSTLAIEFTPKWLIYRWDGRAFLIYRWDGRALLLEYRANLLHQHFRPLILQRYDSCLWKEPYNVLKKPYNLSKEPYDLSKEPYNLSKEPYNLWFYRNMTHTSQKSPKIYPESPIIYEKSPTIYQKSPTISDFTATWLISLKRRRLISSNTAESAFKRAPYIGFFWRVYIGLLHTGLFWISWEETCICTFLFKTGAVLFPATPPRTEHILKIHDVFTQVTWLINLLRHDSWLLPPPFYFQQHIRQRNLQIQQPLSLFLLCCWLLRHELYTTWRASVNRSHGSMEGKGKNIWGRSWVYWMKNSCV